jgi:hypothetical protein
MKWHVVPCCHSSSMSFLLKLSYWKNVFIWFLFAKPITSCLWLCKSFHDVELVRYCNYFLSWGAWPFFKVSFFGNDDINACLVAVWKHLTMLEWSNFGWSNVHLLVCFVSCQVWGWMPLMFPCMPRPPFFSTTFDHPKSDETYDQCSLRVFTMQIYNAVHISDFFI